MKGLISFGRAGLLFMLLLAGFGLAGCASDEADNASSRPWNTPKVWENGLPSSITEGR